MELGRSAKKSPFQLRVEMESSDTDQDFNLPSPQLVEKLNVPTFSFPPLTQPFSSPYLSLTPPPFRLKRPLPSPGLMKKQAKAGFGGQEMSANTSLLSPSAQAYGLTFLDKAVVSCESRPALSRGQWSFGTGLGHRFPRASGLPSPPTTPFLSRIPRCRLRKLRPFLRS